MKYLLLLTLFACKQPTQPTQVPSISDADLDTMVLYARLDALKADPGWQAATKNAKYR